MPRVLVVLLASAALLVAPAAASATLVFGKQPSRGQPSIWAANDDGSGAVKLATGYYQPTISPDGATVAAFRQTRSGANRLYVLPAAGGTPRRLLANAGFATLAWSPDSSTSAVSTRVNAATDVYTIPVAGGAPTRLTTDGQSSSPVWGPTQIAYSRGPF